jgi:hypothetical protein
MKLIRPLVLALAIAGGFFYFTTWRSNPRTGETHPAAWISPPDRVQITEAAPGEPRRRRTEQHRGVQEKYSLGGQHHVARGDL